jgi:thymidylate kinase
MSAERATTAPPPTLPIIAELLTELHARRIRYCHWKSTPSIAVALQGRTDLDLLVDRRHAGAFGVAIREVGFKPFISSQARRFPGVEDHIGHDATSGRLVHLHVYYQLVLGEEHVKNHRLPLEDAFLDGAHVVGGIAVPAPALELTVLGLRVLLKYRDADAVKDLLGLGRRGGIPPDARRELAALRHQATDDELRATVSRHLPSVEPDLVPDLLAVIERDPRDAAALRELRARARRGLAPYERMSRSRARVQYARARLARVWPIRQLLRVATRSDMRRKAPLGGGVTIAVVGSDGAGKSTLIEAMREWLAWRVNLRIEYLGSAQPSRRTRLLRTSARAARAVARRAGGLPPLGRLAARLMAARYLADARDRAERARRGRSLAARGAVVIFDRFPLPGVRVGSRAMDGPRIPTIPAWEESPRLRRMAAREAAIYASVPAPDHIIWLAVDPTTALRRKPDHSPEAVVAKAEALESADLARIAPVTRIDATRPLEEVLEAAKQAIWSLL